MTLPRTATCNPCTCTELPTCCRRCACAIVPGDPRTVVFVERIGDDQGDNQAERIDLCKDCASLFVGWFMRNRCAVSIGAARG
jgi:hypothetical protein